MIVLRNEGIKVFSFEQSQHYAGRIFQWTSMIVNAGKSDPSYLTIVAAKNLIHSDLGEEIVILNFKDGVYYGLDPVGACIWKLIQTPRTLGDVRDAVLQEYEVEAASCERDILNFIQKLADEGLVEIADETAS